MNGLAGFWDVFDTVTSGAAKVITAVRGGSTYTPPLYDVRYGSTLPQTQPQTAGFGGLSTNNLLLIGAGIVLVLAISRR